jgi:hypothetical protein
VIRKLLIALALIAFVLLALVAFATWRASSQVKRAGLHATVRVLFWLRVWTFAYRVPFPMALAILSNEGASWPTDGTYLLGDRTIARGPAVGPGQVLRINVERLWKDCPSWLAWFVRAPSAADLSRVGNERQAMWAAVQIMREALDAARGDVHEAERRYNGSGDKAEAYADRADLKRALFETA